MYSPSNFTDLCLESQLINETMMYAVLTEIADLAGYGDYDSFEALSEVRDSERDPEVIAAYMEKYKPDIKIGLAKEKSSKPSGYNTEEAFNLYVKTVEFLGSENLAVPSLEIEFVIGNALEEEYEAYQEMFDEADTHYTLSGKDSLGKNRQSKPVKTWDDFEQYVFERSQFIGGTKEEAQSCKEGFISYMEDIKLDEGEEFNRFYPSESDFIYHCLDQLFNPNTILELSFYDNDYDFLRTMTVDEIKASPINKYAGIVPEDDFEEELE